MNSIGSFDEDELFFSLFWNISDWVFHADIVSRIATNISFDTLRIKGEDDSIPANFLLSSILLVCLKNENETFYNAGYHLKIKELK